MIYKIKQYKNKLVEKAYKEGMRDLGDFFGVDWKNNLPTPSVCILKNRIEIDLVRQYKTEKWIVGFGRPGSRTVYVLDNKNMAKESSHKKYSDKEYISLIKHELCHVFYDFVSDGNYYPVWLTEGVSIYLSGQIDEKQSIKKFKNFLNFFSYGGSGVYSESGIAVKLLTEKFGKKKLLRLISMSKRVNNKKDFLKLFKTIYGISLSYVNFNYLLGKQKRWR